MSLPRPIHTSQSFKLIPSTKNFVIRPKLPQRQSKPHIQPLNIDCQRQLISVTNSDTKKFFDYMIDKSQRFKKTMAVNFIINQGQFCQKYLYQSTCIKTLLKTVLDKFYSQKRLGQNLKGMNKSNLQQIQNTIWTQLERQIILYQNQKKYIQQRDQLKKQLDQRKRQILNDMNNISKKIKDGFQQKQENNNQEDNQDSQNTIKQINNNITHLQHNYCSEKEIKNQSSSCSLAQQNQVEFAHMNFQNQQKIENELMLQLRFKSLNNIRC